MKFRYFLFLVVNMWLSLGAFQSAVAQTGGSYDLSWWTSDSGGGGATGGSYNMFGVAGQPDAEDAAGCPYEFKGGFILEEIPTPPPGFQTKLTASDATPGDQFGYAIAIDIQGPPNTTRRIVVGAPFDDDVAADSGAVYVFEYDTGFWYQRAKIKAAAPVAGDQFGAAVDVQGGTILVGAWLDDAPGSNSGSAYIFQGCGTTWSQVAQLTASDLAAGDNFGISVSLSGNRALIGSPRNDDAGDSSGSAYFYEDTSFGGDWSSIVETKVTFSTAAPFDRFGNSVSIDGSRAAIGCYLDDDLGSNSGAVLIFNNSIGFAWNETQKLVASDGITVDQFGRFVALDGPVLAVGVPLDNALNLASAGSIYTFVFNGASWVQEAKILASDITARDEFGYGISVDGAQVLSGARLNDLPSPIRNDAGKGYLHEGNFGTWTESQTITALDGLAGDQYGFSTGLESGTAIIGAPLHDAAGSNAGAVYLYGVTLTGPIPTVTPTASRSASPTNTVSPTPSMSPTRTPTASRSPSASRTPSASPSPTRSPSPSRTPTLTATITPSPSPTPTVSVTPSPSPTSLPGTKLTASDGFAGDQFGYSVSINQTDSTVVVGAPLHDALGSSAGAAYVFQYTGSVWIQRAKLMAFDGLAGDQFGYSVSVSGSYIAVGSPLDNHVLGTDAGSVYVFRDTSGGTWSSYVVTKLTASDGAAVDQFGAAVSLSGSFLAVGAPLDDDYGSSSGAAYIFEDTSGPSDWSSVTESKLTAYDGAVGDRFGISVATDGTRTVVGSYLDDDAGSNSGSAYTFLNSGGWAFEQKLFALDATTLDQFGKSVAIDSDVIMIGSQLDDDSGASSGSAYMFRYSGGWTQQAKIAASDASGGDEYGCAVAVHSTGGGGFALSGAHLDDPPASNAGSAYSHQFDGVSAWPQDAKLTAFDALAGDAFGFSVSLNHNDQAVIGAPLDDSPATDAGSAYVVDLN